MLKHLIRMLLAAGLATTLISCASTKGIITPNDGDKLDTRPKLPNVTPLLNRTPVPARRVGESAKLSWERTNNALLVCNATKQKSRIWYSDIQKAFNEDVETNVVDTPIPEPRPIRSIEK